MDGPQKRCSTCEVFKPLTEFYKNRCMPDGLQNVCKSCTSAYGKSHYARNTEKVLQRHMEYWKENREWLHIHQREKYQDNRDKESERKRRDRVNRPDEYKRRSSVYRENNKEKLQRKSLEHYQTHREMILQRGREYYSKHPEKAYVRQQRRRARRQALPDNYTQADREYALIYWHYSCAVCKSTNHIELDHWIPLNSPDCPGTILKNMLPLCRRCNRSKRYNDPLIWLRKRYPKDSEKILESILKYFQQTCNGERR